MEIREISEKRTWEEFVLTQTRKTFLQSWNWGEFNKNIGNRIFRFGVYENSILHAVFLVMRIAARRGAFLFLPQGPIGKEETLKNLWPSIVFHLKNLADREKCGFVRVSPILKKTEENNRLFQELGFRQAPIHMHAELMWILDIRPPEEVLLKNMRKTTRYSIKKAARDGVIVTATEKPEDLRSFSELYNLTAARQHFVPFSTQYLETELAAFRRDSQATLILGKYRGSAVAGAIVVFYGGVGFYHHGASSLTYPNVPAAYLVQWEAIREARRRGCVLYNFWGIAKEEDRTHPWAGLTLFKQGFGGKSETFLEAQDLIISPRYWLSFLVEKLRKARRNF